MALAAAAGGESQTGVDTAFDPAVNMARQAMYRFAALSFLDPRHGSWDRLNALGNDVALQSGAALIRSLPETRSGELGLGESPIERLDPRHVLDRLPGSADELNARYESMFGLVVSGNCPPYETEYINSKYAYQRSNSLADIRGFYQAFGMAPSERNPERPDHLVLELEFMAALLGLERLAEEGDGRSQHDRQQVCREAQSRFLEEHLAWWTPSFARLLGIANEESFYAAAGSFLMALIPAERALLGVAAVSRPVGPDAIERPECCEGCSLTGAVPDDR
ncbi:MAG: molecular chaperone TorD family protein [Pirellulales bacterium]|nr:molecular chaperone TorD family protein [Pirellulales bacterium]